MANLRLKKTILEVVDNQLKANDPPCTKDTYEKLMNAGYSKSEAKDKIGAVVLTEIYDILKKGQPFDEERYKSCLEEMLRQSIDFEDDHHIETEWDVWDDLAQKGYECFAKQKSEEGLRFWREAWDIFQTVLEQDPGRETLYDFRIHSEIGWGTKIRFLTNLRRQSRFRWLKKRRYIQMILVPAAAVRSIRNAVESDNCHDI